MGGEGNGYSSMSGGGTVGKGSLSVKAKGEVVSTLVEDPSVGDERDERWTSIGKGIGEVGSNLEGGFRVRISYMERIWGNWEVT
ncbi:hypothetical protein KI387_028614, partial [Taxus chinensis]